MDGDWQHLGSELSLEQLLLATTCGLAAELTRPTLVAHTDRIGLDAVDVLDTAPAVATAVLAVTALLNSEIALVAHVAGVA